MIKRYFSLMLLRVVVKIINNRYGVGSDLLEWMLVLVFVRCYYLVVELIKDLENFGLGN